VSELPRGAIKTVPEDFVVEEIPAYEPSGTGEHLYLHFEKKNLTTDAAVRAITRALGVEMRGAGIAGMKDKIAVTTQWISIPAATKDATVEERARALSIPNVRILEAKRHVNKLKTGHLRGNRFDLVVRGIDEAAVPGAIATLERLGREGVPNAFGAQRFGKHGDTHELARSWLTGKTRVPSDARLRRLHFSALQSAIFNAVLAARVEDGTWCVPRLGDLLKKEDTGGLFLCTDVQTDRERAARGELCPTGPIVGDRMRQPEGDVRALEERLAAPLLEGIDLARTRALGEGTRRALRLRVDGLSVAQVMDSEGKGQGEQGCALRVRFVLPKGAYATTVLANAFEVVDASRSATEADGIEETHQEAGRTEEE
jgi:tRNA pseudouridine13 synthase